MDAVLVVYCMAWVYIVLNVLENTKVPSRSVVMGVPGNVVREANDDGIKRIKNSAQDYLRLSKAHHEGRYQKIH